MGSRGSRRSNLQAQKDDKNARVCIRCHCPEWDKLRSFIGCNIINRINFIQAGL